MRAIPDENLPNEPLLFETTFERMSPDESKISEQLAEVLHSIMETTFKDSGHAIRGVHAKSHGLLRGSITILDDLPVTLCQGVFATPGKLPVILRFSTNPGDILEDNVSTPRGLAMKIIGVEGARLPGSEGAITQDFVMINAKAFASPTPKAFLKTLKLLAKTTDRAPRTKKALSALLRGVERTLESVGAESATLKSLGGHPQTHILGESFNTAVPILYGLYYAKIAVVPVSSSLIALTNKVLDLSDSPHALRDAVKEFFEQNNGVWEVRVQLGTDIEKMPIEDASVEWPEFLSPYITVARIDVGRQSSWSEEKINEIEEKMSFSPWHGIAAHRPLGGIMRVRKPSYEMSAGFRALHNGCPIHEPRG